MQILSGKKNFISNNLNYQTIILIGLLLLLIYIAFFLFLFDLKQDPWMLADWLVNYQDGGFKRRGLSGSFFFCLQDFTGISLVYLVYSVQLLFYILFFTFFYKLISEKNIPAEYFILIFSPLTLLFIFNDIKAIGRKEIMLLALFTLCALWQSKKNYTKIKQYFIIVSLFIFTLWHELVFFYIPYFIILHLAHHNPKDNISKHIKTYSLYVSAALMPVILIHFFGTEIDNGKSYEILNQRGITMKGGIFSWNVNTIQTIKSNLKDYLLYLISFIYGCMLFFFYFKKFGQKYLIYLFIISLVFSLPLFILAIDWGRWLFIHFTLVLILLGSMLKPKENSAINNFSLFGNSYYLIPFLILNLIIKMPHYSCGISLRSKIVLLIKAIINLVF